jgi:hypothetical protein
LCAPQLLVGCTGAESNGHERLVSFVHELGHEIRSPIAAIIAACQILRTSAETGIEIPALSTLERQVGYLRRSAKHNLRIVDHASPCRVQADPTRLQQVLVNLLKSAAKYRAEGGQIQLGIVEVGEDVQFSVTDNGRGMGREQMPHRFENYAGARGRSRPPLRVRRGPTPGAIGRTIPFAPRRSSDPGSRPARPADPGSQLAPFRGSPQGRPDPGSRGAPQGRPDPCSPQGRPDPGSRDAIAGGSTPAADGAPAFGEGVGGVLKHPRGRPPVPSTGHDCAQRHRVWWPLRNCARPPTPFAGRPIRR